MSDGNEKVKARYGLRQISHDVWICVNPDCKVKSGSRLSMLGHYCDGGNRRLTSEEIEFEQRYQGKSLQDTGQREEVTN